MWYKIYLFRVIKTVRDVFVLLSVGLRRREKQQGSEPSAKKYSRWTASVRKEDEDGAETVIQSHLISPAPLRLIVCDGEVLSEGRKVSNKT